ncbi:hypothetical protein [Kitasatospora sp. NPDC054795]
MPPTADFRGLSEHLTGTAPLDARLSDAFQQRVLAAYPADLPRLLNA